MYIYPIKCTYMICGPLWQVLAYFQSSWATLALFGGYNWRQKNVISLLTKAGCETETYSTFFSWNWSEFLNFSIESLKVGADVEWKSFSLPSISTLSLIDLKSQKPALIHLRKQFYYSLLDHFEEQVWIFFLIITIIIKILSMNNNFKDIFSLKKKRYYLKKKIIVISVVFTINHEITNLLWK